MAVLGPTPFAARLPFALAAWLALFLLARLFEDERGEAEPAAALASLALSPAFLLFGRQSRYYALTALGAVLVLWSWRRLEKNEPFAALALVAALQFLLHSSFAFFAVAVLALSLDAALGWRSRLHRRYAAAAAWTAVLSVPAALYFRVWDRPGNHLYGSAEAFEFLKTFLLWISLFSVPALLPAAAAARGRRWGALALGAAVFCGLAAEGAASRAAAALALAWLGWEAVRASGLERRCLLWVGASLALLSTSAAEPYGRYLMGAMPALAALAGLWCARLAGGRIVPAAGLAAALCAVNWAGWLPVRAASALTGAESPVVSVSGMMRHRARDVGPRSDLARFLGELARGPEGYVDRAAAAIKAGGGETAWSDADNLSLMFAAGIKPVYRDELAYLKPDWLLISPWLRLDPQASIELAALAGGPAYEHAGVVAPLLLWQNNPDPLFRDFAPRAAPLALFRRKAHRSKDLRASGS